MLSAYMRFKYPNVIDAALAASAPIYMITFTGSEREFFFPAVTKVMDPLQDPVTWYGINYGGTQVTQWDFQTKGTRTSCPA